LYNGVEVIQNYFILQRQIVSRVGDVLVMSCLVLVTFSDWAISVHTNLYCLVLVFKETQNCCHMSRI